MESVEFSKNTLIFQVICLIKINQKLLQITSAAVASLNIFAEQQ
jgi:hypothetical protein